MFDTTQAVLNNMYYQGTVQHENMAKLKTRNYVIEMYREEVGVEFLNVQYCYRCILVFKDLLGNEVRRLVFSEAQAATLIDNMSMVVYNDYIELHCLSNILGPTINETYSIVLKAAEEHEEYHINFQILCYNNILETVQPVLTTVLTLDELDELINMMFFVYLIDLVSDRKSIYQV